MKIIIRILFLVISICFVSVAIAQHTKLVYTCPMHPEVQLDKPGDCTKCGMTLKKKVITINTPASQTEQNKQPASQPANRMPDTMPMGNPAKQMHHNDRNASADTSKATKQTFGTSHMDHSHMDGMNMDEPMNEYTNMSHSYSLNLPMNRNGSGTGWLPDASPMYGYMFHTNKWMYMLHGNLFLRYNNQDFASKGSRGGSEVDAPDWLMFMGQRQVGKMACFISASCLLWMHR